MGPKINSIDKLKKCKGDNNYLELLDCLKWKRLVGSRMEIKPNYKRLGKKFGNKTKDVVKLIEQMKPEELQEKMKLGEFEIEKDDLIIKINNYEKRKFRG